MKTMIDYVLEGTAHTINVPSTMTICRQGKADCLADQVEAGDVVCVNDLKGTVTEVGSVVILGDGTKQARTILSGGG